MKNQNPLPEIPHFPVMLNEVINICLRQMEVYLLIVLLEAVDIQKFFILKYKSNSLDRDNLFLILLNN